MLWETLTVLLLTICLVQAYFLYDRRPRTDIPPAEPGKGKPPTASQKGKEKAVEDELEDELEDEGSVSPSTALPFPPKKRRRTIKRVAVVLGSGGHTTEALALVSALNFQEYFTRRYIISTGDTLSKEKALELESQRFIKGQPGASGIYNLTYIPRARRVHQSLLLTPPTALKSFLTAFGKLIIRPNYDKVPQAFADVLIMTGPGTCVTIVLAIWLGRILRYDTPKLVYVESFARVNRLSLTGRILRWGLVDKFVVQWPQLEKAVGKNAVYRGLLV